MRAALAKLQQFAPAGAAAPGPADEPIYLWPCNVQAWNHWWAVQSQWRSGPNGLDGMDYAGLRAFLDELDLPGPERRALWSSLRACERETLDTLAELRKRNQPPT